MMNTAHGRPPVGAFILLLVGAGGLLGCGVDTLPLPAPDDDDALVAGDVRQFSLEADPSRRFTVAVPLGWDGASALPLIFALHGGGGRAETFPARTCPGGDTTNPACLVNSLTAREALVVIPDGTGEVLFSDWKSWNAGGGGDGRRCPSGRACEEGVDDVAYLDDLTEALAAALPIDRRRIHAVGFGAGGSMAHRLGCERATRYASIVSVAGGNQLGLADACFPARAVPVLQIHGDDDPCWDLDGNARQPCGLRPDGSLASIHDTVDAWRLNSGCHDEAEEIILGVDHRGETIERAFGGCDDDGEVVMIIVGGGGHTWPNGQQYIGADRIGHVSTAFDANRRIATFMLAKRLPEALLELAP